MPIVVRGYLAVGPAETARIIIAAICRRARIVASTPEADIYRSINCAAIFGPDKRRKSRLGANAAVIGRLGAPRAPAGAYQRH